MCGISGIFARSAGRDAAELSALARAMAYTMAHRGPDDAGGWADASGQVGLGHRRLSILDLSPLGHQPMASASGRFMIVFNGEIYNFLELKAELSAHGHRFKGGSDTEIMLAAFEQWGRDAVARMNGMFAFALWDERERTLLLGRDRLGKKPLYYGQAGGDFVFGSELKALRRHQDFDPEIDRDALCLYFRHNYIPAPHSIHKAARKLPAGHTLLVRDGRPEAPVAYWSPVEAYARGLARPFAGSEEDAADELERLLRDATAVRMLADVPIGAFLSGGVDSSLVVALMQAQSSLPVRTFSIGFGEERFNEAPHAAAVARHLGTDHTELILAPDDLLQSLPLLPRHWDEPFADSSQFATLCVCEMARRHVTVALSGDGGDELFYGYGRYSFIDSVWGRVGWLPVGLRRALAGAAGLLPGSAWGLLGALGPKLQWRIKCLGARDFADLYRLLISMQREPESFVPGGREPDTAFVPSSVPGWPRGLDRYQHMSLADILAYLPDDILCKVDRASMAVSLETRAPLLDYRVLEFAASLPTAYKCAGGESKRALRRVLYRHVPRALIERPKMGFGVPVEDWLKGPLRSWAEDLLDEGLLRRQGLVDAARVRRMWMSFLGGQRNWHPHLWAVLMLQAWLAESTPPAGS